MKKLIGIFVILSMICIMALPMITASADDVLDEPARITAERQILTAPDYTRNKTRTHPSGIGRLTVTGRVYGRTYAFRQSDDENDLARGGSATVNTITGGTYINIFGTGATGSVISSGNIWIIVAIVVVAAAAITVLIIAKKKK